MWFSSCKRCSKFPSWLSILTFHVPIPTLDLAFKEALFPSDVSAAVLRIGARDDVRPAVGEPSFLPIRFGIEASYCSASCRL